MFCSHFHLPSSISIIFLNHAFFLRWGNHGFIVALKLLVPKKQQKSISTFEEQICWFAGCRVRAEVSIEELAHQRDPHRPPPLPPRPKCTMMNFAEVGRVLLRMMGNSTMLFLVLQGWAKTRIIPLLALPTFSVNFVNEFALFFIFRPGNWETQSLSPPPPPTYKDFFATVSRESLLFAS